MDLKFFRDIGLPAWLIVLLFVTYLFVNFFLKSFVSDYLKEFAVNSIGPNLGTSIKRPIKGIWKGTFDYTSSGAPKQATHYLAINQVGFVAYGKTIAGDKPFNKVSGKIQDRQYYTGTWKNSGEDVSYGAFQFFIVPNGQFMIGKWVGFNRRNEIMHGEWVWSKICSGTTKEEVKKYQLEFAKSQGIG